MIADPKTSLLSVSLTLPLLYQLLKYAWNKSRERESSHGCHKSTGAQQKREQEQESHCCHHKGADLNAGTEIEN